METEESLLFDLMRDKANHPRRQTGESFLVENMNKLKRKQEELNSRKEDVKSKIEVELQPRKKLKEEAKLWLDNVREINVEIQSIEEKYKDITWSERARLSEQVAQKIQEVEELYQKGSFSEGLVVDARARLSEQVAQKTQEVEELYQKGSFSEGLVVDARARLSEQVAQKTQKSAALDYMSKKFNHHRSLDEYMNKLKRKQEELNSRKEDVKSKIEVELQPGKKLKEEAKLWLANVQIIDVEIQDIENEVKEDETWKRAGLRERVAEKIQEVEELYQKGSFSEGLVVDAPPRKGAILPTTELAGETTAVRKMEEIWECLINDDVRKIGVYGMGGSGKTTIMKHINNRILEKKIDKFNCVIRVTVSKPLNVKRLQNDIARRLRANISECEDETIRAEELFDILREKEKLLLILDDMWDAFPLDVVGIPEPTPDNGCKIMLMTRSLDVCKQMDCKDIKMELLSKEEAWKLFLDIVGDDVLKTPGLKETAERVAKECACLPLAVVTIAGAMKGVIDIREWRNVLKELKQSTNGLKEMQKVFGQLKYSYSHLEDEEHRRCLLYCALYPEDYPIKRDQLIEFLIVEGIIGEMKSRQAQLNKGHSILNKLEKVCLLERVDGSEHVKMHDLIRDMALQIMGRGCMVEAGVKLEDLPDDENWTEDLEWVSLMDNHIMEIRDGASPRCGRLSTLLLSGNLRLRRIPDSFFVHMSGLKVLDLAYTPIIMLPITISDMENLTALLLGGCEQLKYVPSLTKLGALKALDLSKTGIKEVPEGMEMLINLKYLNIEGVDLETFPSGILRNLSRLQYLRVDSLSENISLKGEDVASLTKLESFEGTFYDVPDFNIYVRSLEERRLLNYFIQVGPVRSYADYLTDTLVGDFDYVKQVAFCGCILGSRENPVVLPEDCCNLHIEKCHDMRSLSDVLPSKHDFLKHCYIQSCDGIEYVISWSASYSYTPCDWNNWMQCVISLSSSYSCTPCDGMETLFLTSLQNLRAIYKVGASSPPLPPGTFSCLKHLNMSGCPNMKELFTPTLLPHLQNLETINVSDCSGMEEIIAAADNEREGEGEGGVGESSNRSIANNDDTTTSITLPKLRDLTLLELPKLTSIVNGRAVMVCESLRSLSIKCCSKLKRLPLSLPMDNGQPSPPPSLERIRIGCLNGEWWESLEWDHPTAKDVLEPFVTLW